MREFAELRIETWTVRVGCQAAMALTFAAVLSFLGPFGTNEYPVFARLGYWTLCLAVWPVLVAGFGRPLARRLGAPAGGARSLVTSTLISSLPMLAVTIAATTSIIDWSPEPGRLAEHLGGIWLIGATYTFLCDRALAALLVSRRATHPGAVDAPGVGHSPVAEDLAIDEARENALFDRLPLNIGRDLLCLQVEDHYVRVYTTLGNALVLMRFSDALSGLNAARGLRVHRSWWVASKAITGLQRAGRTAELTLSNGVVVPVSQPYLADVTQQWAMNAL